MRAVWIDEGNNSDWDKLARHEITACFFHMFDPRVTQQYLIDVRSHLTAHGTQYGVGVYVAWNWPQVAGGNGTEFAEKVSARLDEIVPRTSGNAFPKVQLNVELHDPIFIQDMVVRWRQLRKYRDTSWTMEPYQGGWMSPNMVDAVVKARVRVVPQMYFGDMSAVNYEDVIKDLTVARPGFKPFPRSLVTPHYDAAALPEAWSGFAFTQGRLS